jgi:tryptophan 2,3-dioxygenase
LGYKPYKVEDSTADILEQLKAKFDATSQDMNTFLKGLSVSNYITYWDYIHLDTLLTLQKPKTDIPDEEIFIVYHQITELFFRLSINELKQITEFQEIDSEFFIRKVLRVNRYFKVLSHSFDIMSKGLDPKQYLKFRDALAPASGFQSFQYRVIEIMSTELLNLVEKSARSQFTKDSSVDEMFEHIYWKKGANDAQTGKKTYTLIQFEEKYQDMLLNLAREMRNKNIWACYERLKEHEKPEPLIEALKQLDADVNVNWPLSHFRTAVQYLVKGQKPLRATGGSNWREYLRPKIQQRMFYPELWTEEERLNWGRNKIDVIFSEINS